VIRIAFARLVDAINAPTDHELLDRAVAPTVQVDRHAPDGALAERFAGRDALAGWFARTPAGCVFALVDEPRPVDAAHEVTYAITVGEFRNGGRWVATFASDGRIATLAHLPFPLEPR
jgi:hypothetical protein